MVSLWEQGDPVRDADPGRLSVYQYAHLNVPGHYSFVLPDLTTATRSGPLEIAMIAAAAAGACVGFLWWNTSPARIFMGDVGRCKRILTLATMATPSTAVRDLSNDLQGLGWVSDLMVAGSLATGDYQPSISDLDLVALVDGPVDTGRQAALATIHRRIDRRSGAGLDVGCVYVDTATISHIEMQHPTWTHGQLVHRILSRITRAELVLYGYEVLGRSPRDVFAEVSADDIRAAARAELTGYWAWAARRPWLWLDPIIAELGLTSMARGRHALNNGELLTKTQAIKQAHAPTWLIDHLSARRRGEAISLPRLRTALVAWRDARRTVAHAKRAQPPRLSSR